MPRSCFKKAKKKDMSKWFVSVGESLGGQSCSLVKPVKHLPTWEICLQRIRMQKSLSARKLAKKAKANLSLKLFFFFKRMAERIKNKRKCWQRWIAWSVFARVLCCVLKNHGDLWVSADIHVSSSLLFEPTGCNCDGNWSMKLIAVCFPLCLNTLDANQH